MLTNNQFLELKNRYYKEGVDNSLPTVAKRTGTPGMANNKEQNALRWGYDAALRDVQARLNQLVQGI